MKIWRATFLIVTDDSVNEAVFNKTLDKDGLAPGVNGEYEAGIVLAQTSIPDLTGTSDNDAVDRWMNAAESLIQDHMGNNPMADPLKTLESVEAVLYSEVIRKDGSGQHLRPLFDRVQKQMRASGLPTLVLPAAFRRGYDHAD